MSVQVGILNFDEEPVNKALLARIGGALYEYGPDGEQYYFDGSVGMLYRPLHTTLESRVERQPHVSTAGKVITWDGRLDNRDDLIPEFCNDLTNDQSDVAIVGAAFDRWGTTCFAKLIGDWAIAIWDPKEKVLLLARDYIGIRNLFYYRKLNRTIWCTHVGPLALCGDQFTLCEEYIAGYLASWPRADVTPYQEIHAVPPGQFIRIRHANIAVQKYWTFSPHLKIRHKTDAEYEEQFRHLFRQAVRRRLRADFPILADLSGGLDSSSIVCMADSILAGESVQTTRVDTFSFYDRDEPDEEDFQYLTKVEQKRGRSGYHAQIVGTGDTFALACNRFVPVPGFGMREELKSALSDVMEHGKYKVVLAGNGGDEFLGQAFDPRVQMADLLFRLRITRLAKAVTEWSLQFRRPWIQLLLEVGMFVLPNSIRGRTTRMAKMDPWIDRSFARARHLSARRLEAAEGRWTWLPSVRDAFQTWATLARKMTYALPSVAEKRYPYLDQNLIEFLTSIPTEQLIRPGQRRSLMRRSLSSLLPPEILSRRTKAGSGRCVALTIRKHWSALEEILRTPLSTRLGYVNQAGLHAALVATREGQISLSIFYLLRALSLELWLRDAVARGILLVPREVVDVSQQLRIESLLPFEKVAGPAGFFLDLPSACGVVETQTERR